MRATCDQKDGLRCVRETRRPCDAGDPHSVGIAAMWLADFVMTSPRA